MLKQIADFANIIIDSFTSQNNGAKINNFVIEEVINNWAPKYGLIPTFQCKDENVRSFSISDDAGNKYQIWVESISNKKIAVIASNNKSKSEKRNWKIEGDLKNLELNLSEAYSKVNQWIVVNGNTRIIAEH